MSLQIVQKQSGSKIDPNTVCGAVNGPTDTNRHQGKYNKPNNVRTKFNLAWKSQTRHHKKRRYT